MKRFMFTLMAALFVIAAPNAAQAQWATLNPATVDNNGGEFWDNRSQDGLKCNIGQVILGQAQPSGCSNDRPSGYLPFVNPGITLYKTTSGFDLFNSGTVNVTVFGDIAGQNRNWGWTQTNTPGVNLNTGFGSLLPIEPTAPWQLWVELTNGSYAYSTGNQFAFFAEKNQDGSRNGQVLYVGIEDIALNGGSDKDYNDMFLRLELTSGGDLSTVPEPSTYALMGAGLLGLGFVSRRRKQVTA